MLQQLYFALSMQALASHLKRKNLKMLQEELALPKIPQKVRARTPRTTAYTRKSRPAIKYVSETTLSPQQEHIQDQLRMLLQRPQSKRQSTKICNYSCIQTETKRQKKILPSIDNAEDSKFQERKINHKSAKHYSQSYLSSKLTLDSIFKDQHDFVENYFAEINRHGRR